jgi:hypothetical protein
MATMQEIDAEIARKERLAAIDVRIAQLEQPQQQQQQPQEPNLYQKEMNPGFEGAITEPLTAIAGGVAGTIAGGLEMAARAPFQGLDKAIEEGRKTQETVSNFSAPRTDLGKKSTDFVFNAIDQLGKIPAGWAGIARALDQGSEAGADLIKEIEADGLPRAAGNIILEDTGSPLLATLVESSGAVASLYFTRKSFKDKVKQTQADHDLGLVQKMQNNEPDAELAKYKLENRAGWMKASKQEVEAVAKRMKVDNEFAKSIADSLPKLTKKKTYSAAVGQEWDQGLLNMAQASSKQDVVSMRRMLDIYEKGAIDPRNKADIRPIYEAGKPLTEDIKFLLSKKKEAGQRVGAAAEELRGVKVNFELAVDKFIASLEADGVVFNKGGQITDKSQYTDIDFNNSPFANSEASQELLSSKIKQMTNQSREIDGFNLHTLKQSLPNQISTAKQKPGGLDPKAEIALSNLRRDINDVLRSRSGNYKAANDDFAEIIAPLNILNGSLPKAVQFDWEGINPDKAGNATRTILSNTTKAQDLIKGINDIGILSRKLGHPSSGDAMTRAIFAINLDKRLGAYANQTFQGLNESASGNVIGSLPTSSTDAGIQALGGIMRKVKRVDNKRAIKSMRDYLKESEEGKK